MLPTRLLPAVPFTEALPLMGANTGTLLAGDLLTQPIVVRNGALHIPDQAGLGVSIDERQVALYASGWQEVAADTKPD